MLKILKCYLIPKKSYVTLSKGAIFFGQFCRIGVVVFLIMLETLAALRSFRLDLPKPLWLKLIYTEY